MKIAVLGYGVVGSGVDELLRMNRQEIARRAGAPVEIKYIFTRQQLGDPRQVAEVARILEDPEVELVVEAMGGVEPAFTYLSQTLRAKKHAVTSNKELVAERGAQLMALARENQVSFLCEASVAGGTPLLHPIYQCLAANRVDAAAGILNGTTNFILTKMFDEGMDFSTALAMAQKLGYAEADPTADVEGIDACRKVCILASLLFGGPVHPHQVYTEGITKITDADVAYARSAGYAIKLIGQTRLLEDGRVLAMVTPALVDGSSMLKGVNDVFNGVVVHGNATEEVFFYGRGAGKLPTASAVVSDVIEIARAGGHIDLMSWQEDTVVPMADHRDCVITAMVRLRGVEAERAKALLGSAVQLQRADAPQEECCLLVEHIVERTLQEKLSTLAQQGVEVAPYIRLLA